MTPKVHIDEKKKQDIRRNIISDVQSRQARRMFPIGMTSLVAGATVLAVSIFVFLPTSVTPDTQIPTYTAYQKSTSYDFLTKDEKTRIVAYKRVARKAPVYLKYKSKLK